MKTRVKRKIPVIALLIICCALIGVGGSIAWLHAQAQVSNQFIAAKVDGDIDEDFEEGGKEKKDVHFENTNSSNIPVYIRAVIVPTWIDEKNNDTGLKGEGTYDITLNEADWFKKGDFYYYKKEVEPDKSTSNLITSCTVKSGLDKAYEGKRLKLEVIAQYIQADGTVDGKPAVADAWRVTVNSDKTLSE